MSNKNTEQPSELFLSEKTTKKEVQACIDSDMFSYERYPSAKLNEDFGILNVPCKNIYYDIDPITGEVIQKYRAGIPLFNDYIELKLPKLYENGFIIDNVTDKFGMNEEEKLVGELAKLQTIMMILEDKEEYEKAAIILKKIDKINKKLNDGSGKY